ncbi:MAG TPA: dTMP kinase [Candidatus Paceibacterota bacterium]
MTTKGKLIVIDGTDGSGKATQTELLVKRFTQAGQKVRKIDFPQYAHNVFGKLLRECLDSKHGDFIGTDPKIASTLYAADRFESSKEIRQWLESGCIVVTDRYVSANQIHQGGKIKDEAARTDFLEWLDEIEYKVFGIPRPDAIVYLHVPIEISLELIRKRAAESGKDADQAESDATHLFDSQQSALKIIGKSNTWTKIDCAHEGQMKTRETISELVWEKLKKVLG